MTRPLAAAFTTYLGSFVTPVRQVATLLTVWQQARAGTERVLEVVDEDTCVLRTGAATLEALAVHLGMLGADFEVSDPPELVDHIRALAGRYHRATPGR